MLQVRLHDVPEWRNWQTRGTQNPVRLKPRVGSTPTSGTIFATTYALGMRCASRPLFADCGSYAELRIASTVTGVLPPAGPVAGVEEFGVAAGGGFWVAARADDGNPAEPRDLDPAPARL